MLVCVLFPYYLHYFVFVLFREFSTLILNQLAQLPY